MNENIDLTKILRDCPKGTKLYSISFGDVRFEKIVDSKSHPIYVRIDDGNTVNFSADGKMYYGCGECALFPSKEQRDWSKFTAPWLKKERFDPKTLHPYDRVLVRDGSEYNWMCNLFSCIQIGKEHCKYWSVGACFEYCIPYNEDTKHLVGTNGDAPEFYRYWED